MGTYLSREDEKKLEECKYYQYPYVKDLKLSVWGGYYMDKNYDYYTGLRMFKVSRALYPAYTRGYLYGYYYCPYEEDPYDGDDEDEYDSDDLELCL